MTNGQVIETLIKSNIPEYNVTKTLEELSELSTALLQSHNKDGKNPQEVIDEIGDVQIRLQILKGIYGEESVNDRMQRKLDKYKKYIEDGKFTGRI